MSTNRIKSLRFVVSGPLLVLRIEEVAIPEPEKRSFSWKAAAINPKRHCECRGRMTSFAPFPSGCFGAITEISIRVPSVKPLTCTVVRQA